MNFFLSLFFFVFHWIFAVILRTFCPLPLALWPQALKKKRNCRGLTLFLLMAAAVATAVQCRGCDECRKMIQWIEMGDQPQIDIDFWLLCICIRNRCSVVVIQHTNSVKIRKIIIIYVSHTICFNLFTWSIDLHIEFTRFSFHSVIKEIKKKTSTIAFILSHTR